MRTAAFSIRVFSSVIVFILLLAIGYARSQAKDDATGSGG
jgi:hypothetical protein